MAWKLNGMPRTDPCVSWGLWRLDMRRQDWGRCDVCLHCPFDCIWKQSEDTPLDTFVRVFPETFNCIGNTPPVCGQCHPVGWGSGLNKKEKEKKKRAKLQCLPFSPTGSAGDVDCQLHSPATVESAPCHDSLYLWTMRQNKPLLP